MFACYNFSSQQEKRKRVQLLHQRFKVFPITQPFFPICGIVWLQKSLFINDYFLGVIAGASLFIPDPNMVFNPERCLSAVLAHIHYFPPSSPSDKDRPLTLGPHSGPGSNGGGVGWRGREHTPAVMESLGELFPYTAVYLLQELISPIVTPFVLFFSLRPKGEHNYLISVMSAKLSQHWPYTMRTGSLPQHGS